MLEHENYDLTFFKFLGGIVVEENSKKEMVQPEKKVVFKAETKAETKEIPRSLLPSKPERASLKLLGKISDIRSRFEKNAKPTMEPVHEVDSSEANVTIVTDHKEVTTKSKKSKLPPIRAMTLAKGYNSGLGPKGSDKNMTSVYEEETDY